MIHKRNHFFKTKSLIHEQNHLFMSKITYSWVKSLIHDKFTYSWQIHDFYRCRHIMSYMKCTTFDNIETKGAIANNEQFLLLQQYFKLNSLIPFPHPEIYLSLPRCLKSCLLQICSMWKRVNISTEMGLSKLEASLKGPGLLTWIPLLFLSYKVNVFSQ